METVVDRFEQGSLVNVILNRVENILVRHMMKHVLFQRALSIITLLEPYLYLKANSWLTTPVVTGLWNNPAVPLSSLGPLCCSYNVSPHIQKKLLTHTQALDHVCYRNTKNACLCVFCECVCGRLIFIGCWKRKKKTFLRMKTHIPPSLLSAQTHIHSLNGRAEASFRVHRCFLPNTVG